MNLRPSLVLSPRVSKYILLATKSNQELIKFYKISAGSESIVSKKSLRLTDKTGWPGCSSFMGTYSTCKNAVWFSANGQKAVIQTEKQSGPLEEPPYWTAWYLMDLSTGQLSEIYRIYSDQDPDFTLVEWLYDRGENVVIQARTDLSNQNLRKYYQPKNSFRNSFGSVPRSFSRLQLRLFFSHRRPKS